MTKVELENEIRRLASLYYSGNTEVTDEEFDSMVDELRSIDPNSEVLNSVGWGSGIEQISGRKKAHKYGLVGSLAKYKTIESLPKYSDIVISAKLDGLSCVLYYINGKLVYALTRGNGTEGIDITDKVLRILNRDRTYLSDKNFTGAIRGELVFSLDDWARFIDKYPEYNSSDKNPRNVAAGLINRNDLSDDLEYVSLVVYNIIAYEGNNIYTMQEHIYDFLIANFSKVCPHTRLASSEVSMNKFSELYNEYKELYPCDGLVYGSNFLAEGKYDQVAFKFDAESKESEVIGIEWQVTRTGRLAPVVLINTVQLSGTNVSRVTAYNAKFVKENNIHVGSRIVIQKSNEIIPKIIAIL